MNETQSSIRVVITLYLVLAFFSIPHLIDDFLFDIPAEFGISVHLTQFLAGIFILIYLGILILLPGAKGGFDRGYQHGDLPGPGRDPEAYPADHQTGPLLERLVFRRFDLWDDHQWDKPGNYRDLFTQKDI